MNGIGKKAPEATDIGGELQRLRKAAGMSRRDLADRTHYSPSHIANVENGIKSPSPEFARACDAALGADDVLTALVDVGRKPARNPTTRRVPAQLPRPVPLMGRDGLLEELDRVLARSRSAGRAPVIALDGEGGVGKTACAVAWADRVRHDYPDGILFVDLAGHGTSGRVDPFAVLEGLLRDLGVDAAEVPTTPDRRTAMLRTVLADTRTLLVVDNALDDDQVRPLLPGSADSLVVVTSRRRLSSLAVHEDAVCVHVDALDEDAAAGLLREVVGRERVDTEPEATARILRMCAYLPLTVRIAGNHAIVHPHGSLADLADEMSAIDHRLDVLSGEAGNIRAVFSWSYAGLDAQDARLFRLLGLHSGDAFSAEAAAALAGIELSHAVRALDRLVALRLLEEVGKHRYRQHDLLKAFAVERVHSEEDSAQALAATTRMVDWYLHTSRAANQVLAPHRRDPELGPPVAGVPSPPEGWTYTQALQWCERELPNIVAVTDDAHRAGLWDRAWKLPVCQWNFFYLRKHWSAWSASHESGLAAARAGGDVFGQAWVLNNLSHAYRERGHREQAEVMSHEALRMRVEIGDVTGQAWSTVALAFLDLEQRRPDAAITRFTDALTLFRRVDDWYSEAIALGGLGEAARLAGHPEQALGYLSDALTVMDAAADRFGQGFTLTRIGSTLHLLGRHDEAARRFDQGLRARRESGDRWGEADTHIAFGDALLAEGAHGRAADQWRIALAILDELDDPRADAVRRRLDPTTPSPRPSPPDTAPIGQARSGER
ncbi:tetratricopeptide repeat protein [Saccharothrix violaceirubra]|uniref:Transcriptional regulator with XRE-family HTH domain/tetratricopeptide (TPR) repeat protein n=1 Tax=Saccharothrix violaceirubra TaxID=413306 RepID=A0A7W7WXP6_9PSEU|nr:tetratricopeptide repeat protein [Saccharothrix violaceirubra]MBB4966858.1 transcriptional regulator with XRE-family HTH domain/tetratricopeptide (TPR) repeat protein [Saccharothrix violaceirubra]